MEGSGQLLRALSAAAANVGAAERLQIAEELFDNDNIAGAAAALKGVFAKIGEAGSKAVLSIRATMLEAMVIKAEADRLVGVAGLQRRLEALASILQALSVAEDTRRTALAGMGFGANAAPGGGSSLLAYSSLLYNATVYHWTIARPLFKPGSRRFLIPSFTRVVEALEASDEPDIRWRVRNSAALACCLLEAPASKGVVTVPAFLSEAVGAGAAATAPLHITIGTALLDAAIKLVESRLPFSLNHDAIELSEQLQRLKAHIQTAAATLGSTGGSQELAALLASTAIPVQGASSSSANAAAPAAAAPAAGKPDPKAAAAAAAAAPAAAGAASAVSWSSPAVQVRQAAVAALQPVLSVTAAASPSSLVAATRGTARLPLPSSYLLQEKGSAWSTAAAAAQHRGGSLVKERLFQVFSLLAPGAARQFETNQKSAEVGLLFGSGGGATAAAAAPSSVSQAAAPVAASAGAMRERAASSVSPLVGGGGGGDASSSSSSLPLGPPLLSPALEHCQDILALAALAAQQNNDFALAYAMLTALKRLKGLLPATQVMIVFVDCLLGAVTCSTEDAYQALGFLLPAPTGLVEALTLTHNSSGAAAAGGSGSTGNAPSSWQRRRSLSSALEPSLWPKRTTAGGVLMTGTGKPSSTYPVLPLSPTSAAAVRESRKLSSIKSIKAALSAASRLKDPYLCELGAIIAFNLALGIVNGSTKHANSILPTLQAAVTCLETVESTDALLVSRLHLACAFLAASTDALKAAASHATKALSIDYGGLRLDRIDRKGVGLGLGLGMQGASKGEEEDAAAISASVGAGGRLFALEDASSSSSSSLSSSSSSSLALVEAAGSSAAVTTVANAPGSALAASSRLSSIYLPFDEAASASSALASSSSSSSAAADASSVFSPSQSQSHSHSLHGVGVGVAPAPFTTSDALAQCLGLGTRTSASSSSTNSPSGPALDRLQALVSPVERGIGAGGIGGLLNDITDRQQRPLDASLLHLLRVIKLKMGAASASSTPSSGASSSTPGAAAADSLFSAQAALSLAMQTRDRGAATPMLEQAATLLQPLTADAHLILQALNDRHKGQGNNDNNSAFSLPSLSSLPSNSSSHSQLGKLQLPSSVYASLATVDPFLSLIAPPQVFGGGGAAPTANNTTTPAGGAASSSSSVDYSAAGSPPPSTFKPLPCGDIGGGWLLRLLHTLWKDLAVTASKHHSPDIVFVASRWLMSVRWDPLSSADMVANQAQCCLALAEAARLKVKAFPLLAGSSGAAADGSKQQRGAGSGAGSGGGSGAASKVRQSIVEASAQQRKRVGAAVKRLTMAGASGSNGSGGSGSGSAGSVSSRLPAPASNRPDADHEWWEEEEHTEEAERHQHSNSSSASSPELSHLLTAFDGNKVSSTAPFKLLARLSGWQRGDLGTLGAIGGGNSSPPGLHPINRDHRALGVIVPGLPFELQRYKVVVIAALARAMRLGVALESVPFVETAAMALFNHHYASFSSGFNTTIHLLPLALQDALRCLSNVGSSNGDLIAKVGLLVARYHEDCYRSACVNAALGITSGAGNSHGAGSDAHPYFGIDGAHLLSLFQAQHQHRQHLADAARLKQQQQEAQKQKQSQSQSNTKGSGSSDAAAATTGVSAVPMQELSSPLFDEELQQALVAPSLLPPLHHSTSCLNTVATLLSLPLTVLTVPQRAPLLAIVARMRLAYAASSSAASPTASGIPLYSQPFSAGSGSGAAAAGGAGGDASAVLAAPPKAFWSQADALPSSAKAHPGGSADAVPAAAAPADPKAAAAAAKGGKPDPKAAAAAAAAAPASSVAAPFNAAESLVSLKEIQASSPPSHATLMIAISGALPPALTAPSSSSSSPAPGSWSLTAALAAGIAQTPVLAAVVALLALASPSSASSGGFGISLGDKLHALRVASEALSAHFPAELQRICFDEVKAKIMARVPGYNNSNNKGSIASALLSGIAHTPGASSSTPADAAAAAPADPKAAAAAAKGGKPDPKAAAAAAAATPASAASAAAVEDLSRSHHASPPSPSALVSFITLTPVVWGLRDSMYYNPSTNTLNNPLPALVALPFHSSFEADIATGSALTEAEAEAILHEQHRKRYYLLQVELWLRCSGDSLSLALSISVNPPVQAILSGVSANSAVAEGAGGAGGGAAAPSSASAAGPAAGGKAPAPAAAAGGKQDMKSVVAAAKAAAAASATPAAAGAAGSGAVGGGAGGGKSGAAAAAAVSALLPLPEVTLALRKELCVAAQRFAAMCLSLMPGFFPAAAAASNSEGGGDASLAAAALSFLEGVGVGGSKNASAPLAPSSSSSSSAATLALKRDDLGGILGLPSTYITNPSSSSSSAPSPSLEAAMESAYGLLIGRFERKLAGEIANTSNSNNADALANTRQSAVVVYHGGSNSSSKGNNAFAERFHVVSGVANAAAEGATVETGAGGGPAFALWSLAHSVWAQAISSLVVNSLPPAATPSAGGGGGDAANGSTSDGASSASSAEEEDDGGSAGSKGGKGAPLMTRAEADRLRVAALDHLVSAGSLAAVVRHQPLVRSACLLALKVGAPLAESPVTCLPLRKPCLSLITSLRMARDTTPAGLTLLSHLYKDVLACYAAMGDNDTGAESDENDGVSSSSSDENTGGDRKESPYETGLRVTTEAFQLLPQRFQGPLWTYRLRFECALGKDTTVSLGNLKEVDPILKARLFLSLVRMMGRNARQGKKNNNNATNANAAANAGQASGGVGVRAPPSLLESQARAYSSALDVLTGAAFGNSDNDNEGGIAPVGSDDGTGAGGGAAAGGGLPGTGHTSILGPGSLVSFSSTYVLLDYAEWLQANRAPFKLVESVALLAGEMVSMVIRQQDQRDREEEEQAESGRGEGDEDEDEEEDDYYDNGVMTGTGGDGTSIISGGGKSTRSAASKMRKAGAGAGARAGTASVRSGASSRMKGGVQAGRSKAGSKDTSKTKKAGKAAGGGSGGGGGDAPANPSDDWPLRLEVSHLDLLMRVASLLAAGAQSGEQRMRYLSLLSETAARILRLGERTVLKSVRRGAVVTVGSGGDSGSGGEALGASPSSASIATAATAMTAALLTTAGPAAYPSSSSPSSATATPFVVPPSVAAALSVSPAAAVSAAKAWEDFLSGVLMFGGIGEGPLSSTRAILQVFPNIVAADASSSSSSSASPALACLRWNALRHAMLSPPSSSPSAANAAGDGGSSGASSSAPLAAGSVGLPSYLRPQCFSNADRSTARLSWPRPLLTLDALQTACSQLLDCGMTTQACPVILLMLAVANDCVSPATCPALAAYGASGASHDGGPSSPGGSFSTNPAAVVCAGLYASVCVRWCDLAAKKAAAVSCCSQLRPYLRLSPAALAAFEAPVLLLEQKAADAKKGSAERGEGSKAHRAITRFRDDDDDDERGVAASSSAPLPLFRNNVPSGTVVEESASSAGSSDDETGGVYPLHRAFVSLCLHAARTGEHLLVEALASETMRHAVAYKDQRSYWVVAYLLRGHAFYCSGQLREAAAVLLEASRVSPSAIGLSSGGDAMNAGNGAADSSFPYCGLFAGRDWFDGLVRPLVSSLLEAGQFDDACMVAHSFVSSLDGNNACYFPANVATTATSELVPAAASLLNKLQRLLSERKQQLQPHQQHHYYQQRVGYGDDNSAEEAEQAEAEEEEDDEQEDEPGYLHLTLLQWGLSLPSSSLEHNHNQQHQRLVNLDAVDAKIQALMLLGHCCTVSARATQYRNNNSQQYQQLKEQREQAQVNQRQEQLRPNSASNKSKARQQQQQQQQQQHPSGANEDGELANSAGGPAWEWLQHWGAAAAAFSAAEELASSSSSSPSTLSSDLGQVYWARATALSLCLSSPSVGATAFSAGNGASPMNRGLAMARYAFANGGSPGAMPLLALMATTEEGGNNNNNNNNNKGNPSSSSSSSPLGALVTAIAHTDNEGARLALTGKHLFTAATAVASSSTGFMLERVWRLPKDRSEHNEEEDEEEAVDGPQFTLPPLRSFDPYPPLHAAMQQASGSSSSSSSSSSTAGAGGAALGLTASGALWMSLLQHTTALMSKAELVARERLEAAERCCLTAGEAILALFFLRKRRQEQLQLRKKQRAALVLAATSAQLAQQQQKPPGTALTASKLTGLDDFAEQEQEQGGDSGGPITTDAGGIKTLAEVSALPAINTSATTTAAAAAGDTAAANSPTTATAAATTVTRLLALLSLSPPFASALEKMRSQLALSAASLFDAHLSAALACELSITRRLSGNPIARYLHSSAMLLSMDRNSDKYHKDAGPLATPRRLVGLLASAGSNSLGSSSSSSSALALVSQGLALKRRAMVALLQYAATTVHHHRHHSDAEDGNNTSGSGNDNNDAIDFSSGAQEPDPSTALERATSLYLQAQWRALPLVDEEEEERKKKAAALKKKKEAEGAETSSAPTSPAASAPTSKPPSASVGGKQSMASVVAAAKAAAASGAKPGAAPAAAGKGGAAPAGAAASVPAGPPPPVIPPAGIVVPFDGQNGSELMPFLPELEEEGNTATATAPATALVLAAALRKAKAEKGNGESGDSNNNNDGGGNTFAQLSPKSSMASIAEEEGGEGASSSSSFSSPSSAEELGLLKQCRATQLEAASKLYSGMRAALEDASRLDPTVGGGTSEGSGMLNSSSEALHAKASLLLQAAETASADLIDTFGTTDPVKCFLALATYQSLQARRALWEIFNTACTSGGSANAGSYGAGPHLTHANLSFLSKLANGSGSSSSFFDQLPLESAALTKALLGQSSLPYRLLALTPSNLRLLDALGMDTAASAGNNQKEQEEGDDAAGIIGRALEELMVQSAFVPSPAPVPTPVPASASATGGSTTTDSARSASAAPAPAAAAPAPAPATDDAAASAAASASLSALRLIGNRQVILQLSPAGDCLYVGVACRNPDYRPPHPKQPHHQQQQTDASASSKPATNSTNTPAGSAPASAGLAGRALPPPADANNNNAAGSPVPSAALALQQQQQQEKDNRAKGGRITAIVHRVSLLPHSSSATTSPSSSSLQVQLQALVREACDLTLSSSSALQQAQSQAGEKALVTFDLDHHSNSSHNSNSSNSAGSSSSYTPDKVEDRLATLLQRLESLVKQKLKLFDGHGPLPTIEMTASKTRAVKRWQSPAAVLYKGLFPVNSSAAAAGGDGGGEAAPQRVATTHAAPFSAPTLTLLVDPRLSELPWEAVLPKPPVPNASTPSSALEFFASRGGSVTRDFSLHSLAARLKVAKMLRSHGPKALVVKAGDLTVPLVTNGNNNSSNSNKASASAILPYPASSADAFFSSTVVIADPRGDESSSSSSSASSYPPITALLKQLIAAPAAAPPKATAATASAGDSPASLLEALDGPSSHPSTSASEPSGIATDAAGQPLASSWLALYGSRETPLSAEAMAMAIRGGVGFRTLPQAHLASIMNAHASHAAHAAHAASTASAAAAPAPAAPAAAAAAVPTPVPASAPSPVVLKPAYGGSGLIFCGHGSLLSHLSPEVLARPASLAGLRYALLLGNVRNGQSAGWLSQQESVKRRLMPYRLAFETSPYHTAALLSLLGVGTIALNRWAASQPANHLVLERVCRGASRIVTTVAAGTAGTAGAGAGAGAADANAAAPLVVSVASLVQGAFEPSAASSSSSVTAAAVAPHDAEGQVAALARPKTKLRVSLNPVVFGLPSTAIVNLQPARVTVTLPPAASASSSSTAASGAIPAAAPAAAGGK